MQRPLSPTRPPGHTWSSVLPDVSDHPEGRTATETRRPLRRLTQACDHCRLRKIKCDLRRPNCANCENRSFVCHFSPHNGKRGPRPKLRGGKAPGAQAHRVDQPLPRSHIRSHVDRPSPQLNLTATEPPQIYTTQSDDHSTNASSTTFNHLHYVSQSSPISALATTADPFQTPTPRHDVNAWEAQAAHGIPLDEFRESASSDLASIYHDLDSAVGNLGLDLSMPSLARTCVNLFFECLYPIMPIVHRPKIELGLCLLQPGIERRELDTQVFTLTTSLCAIAAEIIPSTIFWEGSLVAEKFYHASKCSLNLYRARDLQQPSSASIAIRYFQSGYTHSVGNPRTSWDELEDAIGLAQSMRLHDEASYIGKDYIESQLCRRLFWVLFTGDKSAGILGKHRITLGRYLLENGVSVQYSKSIDGEDEVVTQGSSHQDSTECLPTVITGFNFNQDLWRSAYLVLLEIDALHHRYSAREVADAQVGEQPTIAELSRLAELHVAFETSLCGLPRCLRACRTLSLSPTNFHFDQVSNERSLPRAFALQRINLHASFQCLRLVIVQAMTALLESGIPFWHLASPFWPDISVMKPTRYEDNPDSYPQHAQIRPLDPVIAHSVLENQHNRGKSSTLLLQKIRIAEDMLYILHTSNLVNLRLNGESCVEKIRLVGASMLEIIDHHANSPLANIAENFRDLYAHILAHMESKASDALSSNA